MGILGGGQLGRMLIEAASRLNVPVLSLDVGTQAPAKQISSADHVDGSFSDSSKIQELASKADILTVEIEHVDAGALQQIADACASTGGRSGKGLKIRPSPDVIRIIQDKYQQKLHLADKGVPVADYLPIEPQGTSLEPSINDAIAQFGLPLMLKSRTQAYDGKGNYLLRKKEDIKQAIEALGNGQRKLYAERFAAFEAEIAVMVVKSATGEVKSYDPVETIHKDNICHLVKAPLRRGQRGTSDRARAFAEHAITALGDGAVGIFGVEMFLLPDSEPNLRLSLERSINLTINRHTSYKRNCTKTTQFRSPYYRSVPYITIRKPSASYSRATTWLNCFEGAINSNVESIGQIQQHGRDQESRLCFT